VITKKGYKLFEMNKEGKLFPLFIDKTEEIPVGEWVVAKNIPTKGFATRPGWHIGAHVPDAPWLKGYNGTSIGIYKSRIAQGKRVWCEVEYNATHNYDIEVSVLPGKCFRDKIPSNGCYTFKEVGKGDWVISSDIRIVRVLSEDERQSIILEAKYDEIKEYRKYKVALEKRVKVG